jgi:hypothetical protein
MMGWPLALTDHKGISPAQFASLVGEGLHLGCLGIVFYSAFLCESAPWWSGRPIKSEEQNQQEDIPAAVVPAKRRRRTGCLVPRLSQM